MVNNLGIVKAEKQDGEAPAAFHDRVRPLCESVYDMYRNRDPAYSPHGAFAKSFLGIYSHPFSATTPLIRFISLFDTVGALGVPTLEPGGRRVYEFYDQNVSAEVQTVCQALALHDRFSFFEPCFVRRLAKPDEERKACDYTTKEVWFPGRRCENGDTSYLARTVLSCTSKVYFTVSKCDVCGM
jgi:Uncharacterized alpha/beta hydrolase domain (DUF2235)